MISFLTHFYLLHGILLVDGTDGICVGDPPGGEGGFKLTSGSGPQDPRIGGVLPYMGCPLARKQATAD